MKRVIQLTESDIQNMVKEAVHEFRNNEIKDDVVGGFKDGDFNGGTVSKIGDYIKKDTFDTKFGDVKGHFGNALDLWKSMSPGEKAGIIKIVSKLVLK